MLCKLLFPFACCILYKPWSMTGSNLTTGITGIWDKTNFIGRLIDQRGRMLITKAFSAQIRQTKKFVLRTFLSPGMLQSRKVTRSSSGVRNYLLNRTFNENQVSTTPEACPIPRAPAVKAVAWRESLVLESGDVHRTGPGTEKLLKTDVWREWRNS